MVKKILIGLQVSVVNGKILPILAIVLLNSHNKVCSRSIKIQELWELGILRGVSLNIREHQATPNHLIRFGLFENSRENNIKTFAVNRSLASKVFYITLNLTCPLTFNAFSILCTLKILRFFS